MDSNKKNSTNTNKDEKDDSIEEIQEQNKKLNKSLQKLITEINIKKKEELNKIQN